MQKPEINELDFASLQCAEAFGRSSDGVMICDTDDIIRFFNRGAEEMFGYKSEEALGRSYHFLVPEELLKDGEVKKLCREMEKNGRLERCCVTRLAKGGKKLRLELTRSPVVAENGDPIGHTSIFRDLTSSLEFEDNIRLTEKLEAVGKLVQGLAHELGTPINIIQGHAELIREDVSPEDSQHESVNTILAACNRMTAIMKSLLQFVTRKETEKQKLDVNLLLEDLLNFLRIQFRKQGIRIQKELDRGVPRLLVNKTEMEEIFLNIFMNCVHAMPDGGILTIKASIVNIDGWDYNSIEIQDTGCGIHAENLARIFEPFYTSREVGKGTGLGLYITHNLVQKYRGRINIESSPDEGTTVRILFPLGPENPEYMENNDE